MIDHTGIGVADVARSAAFYDAALGALGLRRVKQLPENDGADAVGQQHLTLSSEHEQQHIDPRDTAQTPRRPMNGPITIFTRSPTLGARGPRLGRSRHRRARATEGRR
jgi:catechol 2,3-dioxygenase-like lactoylglutathione lyase family enzyme